MLPPNPTPNQIDEALRKYNSIGHLLYQEGVKTRTLRDKLVYERKTLREWLRIHRPEALETFATQLCEVCGKVQGNFNSRFIFDDNADVGVWICFRCEDKAEAAARETELQNEQ